MTFPKNPQTRRAFFMNSGRYFTLSGLTALVAAQEWKRRRLASDPNCIKLTTCQDCAERRGCSKPKAEQFRKENQVS